MEALSTHAKVACIGRGGFDDRLFERDKMPDHETRNIDIVYIAIAKRSHTKYKGVSITQTAHRPQPRPLPRARPAAVSPQLSPSLSARRASNQSCCFLLFTSSSRSDCFQSTFLPSLVNRAADKETPAQICKKRTSAAAAQSVRLSTRQRRFSNLKISALCGGAMMPLLCNVMLGEGGGVINGTM